MLYHSDVVSLNSSVNFQAYLILFQQVLVSVSKTYRMRKGYRYCDAKQQKQAELGVLTLSWSSIARKLKRAKKLEEEEATRHAKFKNLTVLSMSYTRILKKLQDEREEIAKSRENGEIEFKEYWRRRMDLEKKIQTVMKNRAEIFKKMMLLFPEKVKQEEK
ncbi:MAG: hypothetical protein BAJATHORv1_10399 [Candidatus Thorarchaeota archaeon]|nr:MAG: hypothetical protein BAJATHORv1_10399 [Candidatus Thorarchaeota archaeon]